MLETPDIFPTMRAFAKKQFDVEVVLANLANDQVEPTISKMASMGLGPGYCELSLYREGVFKNFALPARVDRATWIQGVMIHELGHCVDGLRDFKNGGPSIRQAHAIAPAYARQIVDYQGYDQAAGQMATKLWREAFADTFLVGYWRLTAADRAMDLASALREHREAGKVGDKPHATMCWIDHALSSAPPKNMDRLIEWADTIRQTDICQEAIRRIEPTKG